MNPLPETGLIGTPVLGAPTRFSAAARGLIGRLARQARECEARRRLPERTVRALLDVGLPRMLQPSEFGGGEASVGEFMEVCAVLARGCVSSAWCNFVWGVHGFLVGGFPVRAQRAVWANAPETLVSASLGPVGRARAVRGGLEITGRWGFTSGCDHAEWLLLGATDEHGSRWLCLLPREHCEIVDTWHVAGLSGTGSKDALCSEVLVPAARALSFEDSVDRHRALLTLVIAGPILGAAEAAIVHFAGGCPRELPPAQGLRLSEVSAGVLAMRLLIRNACESIDQALAAGTVPGPVEQLRIARDTAFAAKGLRAAVETLFSAGSALTLRQDHPLQRIWRDVAAGTAHARLRWDEPALAYAAASAVARGAS